ncbi:MAG: divalent-cation tolerance protein CutA [Epsilonproteobacteria bacterium]|nr:divalent-cation tolerance protein CutA [Campylobacterota bacterium]
MKEGVIGYIPTASKQEACSLASSLLEKKLIACANILEGVSMYNWQDKPKREDECLLLVKTSHEQYDQMCEAVKSLHSYDLACIIKIPVQMDDQYFAWLEKQVK